jgi:hypothetical protein
VINPGCGGIINYGWIKIMLIEQTGIMVKHEACTREISASNFNKVSCYPDRLSFSFVSPGTPE